MTTHDRRDTPAGLPAVVRTGSAVATVPAQLREIAKVAGTDAALAILRAKGGTEVWIPHHADPGHWLAQLVGLDMAERICAFYRTTNADGRTVGSVRIYVPMAGTGLIASARQQVVSDVVEHGLTVRQAAQRAGLSERAAHRAIGKTRDTRQGELFPPRD